MAKKPMRTAVGRGQDRAATAKAKYNTAMGLMDKAFDSDGALADSRKRPPGGLYKSRKPKAWALLEEERKIAADSARIKKSGERMARMQALAKSKQPK